MRVVVICLLLFHVGIKIQDPVHMENVVQKKKISQILLVELINYTTRCDVTRRDIRRNVVKQLKIANRNNNPSFSPPPDPTLVPRLWHLRQSKKYFSPKNNILTHFSQKIKIFNIFPKTILFSKKIIVITLFLKKILQIKKFPTFSWKTNWFINFSPKIIFLQNFSQKQIIFHKNTNFSQKIKFLTIFHKKHNFYQFLSFFTNFFKKYKTYLSAILIKT